VLLLALFGTCSISAADDMPLSQPSPSPKELSLRNVVRATLALQPTIILSKEQLAQSGGAITLATADFDWTLASSLNHAADYRPTGASLLYDRVNTTLYDIHVTKKTPYGFSLEPAIQINNVASKAVPGNGIASETDTSLRVSFTLVVPMLQGAGQTVTTARVAAARYDYEAARHDLQHTISQAVYDTVFAVVKQYT